MEETHLEMRELTPELWPQLEALFGRNGACGGCWCWWWRLAKGERWEAIKGTEAHARLRRLVQEGSCHGLLAFEGDEPVGWCSFEPRAAFPKLERARFLQGIPSHGVWSIGCFFVRSSRRRVGVASALLAEAVAVLERKGVPVVEAYPHDTRGKRQPDAFVWTGTKAMFERQGFHPVPGHEEKGIVLRRTLGDRGDV